MRGKVYPDCQDVNADLEEAKGRPESQPKRIKN
jgi:hypothetical protein